ncbi:hypothetical protein [Cupriavidus sp. SS-3]|uniref:hypothetical protein n=1 Tax=Cupriavidus sp. SS-3 TaxID=3109596 RepID=UPI002DB7067C|nr:hypothetical protein [Cupriavidus sp. SS-3]MEC3769056.1 hypothetical protein [Cupriavidus sp. SS-3]
MTTPTAGLPLTRRVIVDSIEDRMAHIARAIAACRQEENKNAATYGAVSDAMEGVDKLLNRLTLELMAVRRQTTNFRLEVELQRGARLVLAELHEEADTRRPIADALARAKGK